MKNRHAYLQAEEQINERIRNGCQSPFALFVLDVNNIKEVNDKQGHKAGDVFLQQASGIICTVFPVGEAYRIGGDEFVAILEGEEMGQQEALLAKMQENNAKALSEGGIVIACGMASFGQDTSLAEVFSRADERMYENKSRLKEGKRQG